jgi:hypothetical protein
MAHELAGALQHACRIRQRCAVKEPHIYVRGEYIDVTEGRIPQTCNRTAVMQKFPDFVPAFSHHLKPLVRDGSQSTCMLFHPRINGGIALDSAVKSQHPGWILYAAWERMGFKDGAGSRFCVVAGRKGLEDILNG